MDLLHWRRLDRLKKGQEKECEKFYMIERVITKDVNTTHRKGNLGEIF